MLCANLLSHCSIHPLNAGVQNHSAFILLTICGLVICIGLGCSPPGLAHCWPTQVGCLGLSAKRPLALQQASPGQLTRGRKLQALWRPTLSLGPVSPLPILQLL